MDFQLKQVKHETSGGTPSVISQYDYTYRRDGSVATWKVEQGGGAQTWTLGYDVTGQLTSAALWDATPAMLESQTYGYDKAGNRTQVGNGSTAPKNYEVNELNQLLTERDHGRTTFAGYVDEPAKVTVNGQPAKVMSTDGGAPFKFEAPVDLDAGVNTVTVQATDGQNNVATKTYEVTTTGDTKKYEYDGSGNLRYEKQPNGTVLREYRWDQQNRLVRVLEGTHESVYEYDGASQRVRIKELESSVETKNERLVWCGGRICQKRASNGTTVVRSYFGNGFEESGPTKYFYTRDHLGSVREVVESDGATVASRLSYDPWGRVTETGSGAKSDFTYTGHYYDRPTGLNLAQYRGYDPSLGRWLSRDPIGLRGGLNLYGYVENGPVNYIDPTGEIAWTLAVPGIPFGALGFATPIVPLIGINVGIWGTVGYNVVALANEWDTDAFLGRGLFATPPKDARDPAGAKAPGKPGEAEGFKDPKTGEEWVRSPKGKRWGWKDRDGKIWVPTGQGPDAHGGPHWDVQNPDGRNYDNVYPGGRCR